MSKRILDVCCGSKMFWFDKENPDVEFCDFYDSSVNVRVVWQDKTTEKVNKDRLVKTGRNFVDKLDALLGEIGNE